MGELLLIAGAMIIIVLFIGVFFKREVDAFILIAVVVAGTLILSIEAYKVGQSAEVTAKIAPSGVVQAIDRGIPISCKLSPFLTSTVLTEYYTEGQAKGTAYETKLVVHDKRTGIGYAVQYCKVI